MSSRRIDSKYGQSARALRLPLSARTHAKCPIHPVRSQDMLKRSKKMRSSCRRLVSHMFRNKLPFDEVLQAHGHGIFMFFAISRRRRSSSKDIETSAADDSPINEPPTQIGHDPFTSPDRNCLNRDLVPPDIPRLRSLVCDQRRCIHLHRPPDRCRLCELQMVNGNKRSRHCYNSIRNESCTYSRN